jgi:hypothetical protein
MTLRITEECINCGACETECPHGAISDVDEVYVIDAARCTGCPDQHPPPCVAVCPVEECLVPSGASAPEPPAPHVAPEPPADSTPRAGPTTVDPMLVSRIIWGSLMVSPAVYVFISASMVVSDSAPLLLRLLLDGVAALLALASLFLPARLLGAALRRLELPVEEVLDPAADRSYREAAPARRRFTDSGAARRAGAPARNVSMVVGLACAEGVCGVGLLSRLLGGSWPQTASLFLVGWALMIACFPSRSRLDRVLERTYRARLE